jgi:altronate dehydratase small subunit
MTTNSTDSRLLLLSADDNVLVITATLQAGETILLNSLPVTLPMQLPLGHKLAAREIAAGEKVIKYGVPIGSAIQRINLGAWVHTHNLKSDYLPTRLRCDQLKSINERLESQ